MITGVVNVKLEATIPLKVVGPSGHSQTIVPIIDTGYNGALTLPLAIIQALGLQQGASREVTLGDTSRRIFDYYNAEVEWDGTLRRVRVLCVEGDPLIGTALLQGYKMEADFVVNGVFILHPTP